MEIESNRSENFVKFFALATHHPLTGIYQHIAFMAERTVRLAGRDWQSARILRSRSTKSDAALKPRKTVRILYVSNVTAPEAVMNKNNVKVVFW